MLPALLLPRHTAAVECWEPGAERWVELSPMHTARKYLGLAAAGGERHDRPGAAAARGGLVRSGSAAFGDWCLWCVQAAAGLKLLGVGMAKNSAVSRCLAEGCCFCPFSYHLQGGS